MITRLIWTIWTPVSSVPKKADKLNLSLSLSLSLLVKISSELSESKPENLTIGKSPVAPFTKMDWL